MNYQKMTKPDLIRALKKLQAASAADQPPDKLKQALHELQVHQIELEMQNRELREAQDELEASRDRYANLYDFAPLGYATLDEQTRISEINLVGAAMLGRERSKLKGKHFTTFVAVDDAAGFLSYLRACRNPDANLIADLHLVPFKSKTKFPAQLRCSAIRRPDDADKFLYRLAIVDMTEQKRAEEALRDSEVRYRRLVEISPDAILLLRDDRIVFANSAAAKLFGAASEQELLDKSPLDFTHPAYNHLSEGFLRQAQNGDETAPILEKKIIRLDGAVRDVEVTAAPFSDHRIQTLQVMLRDVTERKRMEHDLRRSEQEMRTLTLNVPDIVARFDRQYRHVFVNGRIEAFTGLPVKSFIGKTNRDLGMPEDLVVLGEEKIAEVFASGRIVSFEYSFPSPNGLTHFETRLAPELASDGAVETVLAITRDITERKRMEHDLRHREQEIRSITENVPDVVARFDRQLRHVYINKQIELYTGMSAETHIGKTKRELGLPEEVIEAWDKRILEVFDAGKSLTFEFTFPSSQGTGYFECRLIPEPAGDGSVETVLSLTREITERKKADEALRENEAELRALFEVFPGGVSILDRNRNIVSANNALERILKISREDLLKGAYKQRQYLRPDGSPVKPDEFPSRRAFEEQKLVLDQEMQVVLENGETIWVSVSAAPLLNKGVAVVTTDITARKKSDQALRESEAWFKEIFDGSRDAIFLVEADAKFMAVNKAACELTGYTYKEMLAMRIPNLHDEKDLQAFRDHFDAIMSGSAVTTLAYIRRKDGTKIPVEFSNHRIIFRGRPIMHTSARDITERKRAEEERLKLEAQMLHAQKLESLGVLAGGIAHDFNNLLVGVLGNASLALMDLPNESPLRESIQEIETAAQRAAELTNQMLAYSGKGKFVIERILLSKLIKEMVHLLHTMISKKVVLKFDFENDLPAVEGDPTQMRQVVMNLITNAAEAIGNQAGVINVRAEETQVDRKHLADFYLADKLSPGKYVSLKVTDTGIGMDAATKAKIYDPFFTTKFTGRGLGLAAVLGIVRGHHGAIKVDSAPGRGTTFHLLFPVASEIESAGEKTGAFKPASSNEWIGSGLILVIDDEKSVLAVTQKILERAGFTVLAANDGSEGLEIFRQRAGEIKAVMLDLTMPQMDGEEAFQEIRRINPEARVILLSGYSEQEAINNFSGLGLAGFIQKPFQPQKLMSLISSVLT